MKITFLYFLLQPARWYKSNRRHLFVSLRLWPLRPGSYPQFNNPLIGRKRPGEHYGKPVSDLRHHVHGAVPVGAVQRGAWRVQHVSCHKNIGKPIIIWTYWPGGSTILNFRTCGTIPTARNNVVLFQRGSGKYWKSLTARVKVLVQKEIRQHFAGPLPLLHLPQLCRLWHEQQHGVRSKGTSLKIRSDSGLPQSHTVSLNHENHESWI